MSSKSPIFIGKINLNFSSEQISVTYQVEGFRLTQSPGAFAFQQQWLYETLESKAKFIKLVDF